jgi:hypothetical protein
VPKFQKINRLDCPTPDRTPIENVGEFPGLSNRIPTPQTENPGAAATASGAELHTIGIVSREYRNRAEAATSLCLSIANCDPEDACQIMEAALADLRQKVLFDGNPHFAEAVAQYRLERNRSGRVA